jgi:methionyl aminopeptidase
MAFTKTSEEIDAMREGGQLLSRALKAVVDAVAPGVTLRELDTIGERVIVEGGGKPSFKGYKTSSTDTPFPSTICISVNEEIVHGLGNRDRKLVEGDIVGLDIGCWYKDLCTDMAVTVPVGVVSEEAITLMEVTKASMYAGVEAATLGHCVKDIGHAVESVIKPHGYGIVQALVGHGVGHQVHEAPHVPNFTSPDQKDVKLVDGMCIAIEPMVGLGGDHRVETAEDGWGIIMKDGSLGAHFEVTIAITQKGPEILTPLPV